MLFANIFTAVEFNHTPTLSEVIKEAEWGSNRDIRQSGFRVDFNFSANNPYFSTTVKNMERVKDPKQLINHGVAVMPPNGRRVVVVIANNQEEE